ncbi:MAG TPA: DnaA N-terminal domain-containing protein, partial [Bauldia sp.]|nr:DnaA N-terminal domain-containing protein [Bauldia sp.]
MGSILTGRAVETEGGAFRLAQAFEAAGVARGPGGLIDTGIAGQRQEGGSMADRADPDMWQRVKQRLRAELGEDVFNSWFGRAEFEHADKSRVYISVPTRFLKSWIASHYSEKLLALWSEERPGTIQIEIMVRGSVRTKAAPAHHELTPVVPSP